MREIATTADDLVSALLARREPVSILDSCGVRHSNSHLLIAGVRPVEILEISCEDPEQVLRLLDEKLSGSSASIFTLSYGFGEKLLNIGPRHRGTSPVPEPDLSLQTFDSLVIHDYRTGRTRVAGRGTEDLEIEELPPFDYTEPPERTFTAAATSNFSRNAYLSAIDSIKEHIRRGDTYQTNLTQQITTALPASATPEAIFWRLRRDHPAPFAAFIRRADSTVVSASPERFFTVTKDISSQNGPGSDRLIHASPIKGTRRRGKDPLEDQTLRNDLLNSEKDRSENTMIVDLVRNDLGRVCKYGSVQVERLCELEEHPTLFHLVSTVSGNLRPEARFSEILRSTFPCGSITGAPKFRTMQLIDTLETVDRGLSMGAIGYYVPESFGISEVVFDLSVAIRTIVVRGREAVFNVGGGITIESCAPQEYEESHLKAKALLAAMDARLEVD